MADEIQEEARIPAPGLKLKMCREARHLSIEEVAEKLHLRPSVVAELEGDVIDHNISMTFTRGYVRLYARFLDLDPTPLLEEFDELANPVKQPAKLQSFSQKVAKQASDARLMMFTYFVLFVIIAMAVVWWFQQPDSTTSSNETSRPSITETQETAYTTQSEQASSPVETFAESDLTEQQNVAAKATDSALNSDTSESDMSAAELATENNNIDAISTEVSSASTEQHEEFQSDEVAAQNIDLAMATGDDEAGLAAEEQQADIGTILTQDSADVAAENDSLLADDSSVTVSSAEVVSADPVELVFTFTEDCWMNLTDATGEAIAYGIKTAGRVMTVSGIPPFEVKLGAPQAVSLSVAGEPFDMSEFPAGRTATFTVGEAL